MFSQVSVCPQVWVFLVLAEVRIFGTRSLLGVGTHPLYMGPRVVDTYPTPHPEIPTVEKLAVRILF